MRRTTAAACLLTVLTVMAGCAADEAVSESTEPPTAEPPSLEPTTEELSQLHEAAASVAGSADVVILDQDDLAERAWVAFAYVADDELCFGERVLDARIGPDPVGFEDCSVVTTPPTELHVSAASGAEHLHLYAVPAEASEVEVTVDTGESYAVRPRPVGDAHAIAAFREARVVESVTRSG